jgi:hypothetical protein
VVPLNNHVPIDDLIIVGSSSFVAEFATRNAPKSSWITHDLTSGGFWRLETSTITPTSNGSYVSEIPVEKRDLIFEKSFDGETGNVYRLTVSLFNETTNITREGGLPVLVAPNSYKLTYSLTNWTFSSPTMRWVALDICTNGLTDAIPLVELFYPDTETDDPFYFVATNPGLWSLSMFFERWTLFDGELDFDGELIPSFSTSDDYYLRNQRNVTIVYPIDGVSNFEYDPTTFVSIFGGELPSENPPGTAPTNKSKKPLWIIGVVVGIVVLAVIITVILFLTVPSLQNAITPYTAKKY